jgi:hypothetical protein
MNNQGPQNPDRRLRTPRAAAIAGVVFGLLMIATFTIINMNVPAVNEDTGAWLETSVGSITIALALVPFAGIAFLWFMGVLRDRIGLLEDQFFSTLFIGSGLLYLGLVFTGAAIAGGLITAYALEPSIVTETAVYIFARAVMYRINNVYSIRMAGMFMFVLATIWVRTGVMPRLLGLITYAVAILLLVSISFFPWMVGIFPTWVLLISVYILVLNYRNRKDDHAGAVDDKTEGSAE